MAGNSKEREAIKEECELLKNQVKIKDETLWEIKNQFKDDPVINKILQKTEDMVERSIKDSKGNKGQGLKNVADEIEGQLRLEVEKLTFN